MEDVMKTIAAMCMCIAILSASATVLAKSALASAQEKIEKEKTRVSQLLDRLIRDKYAWPIGQNLTLDDALIVLRHKELVKKVNDAVKVRAGRVLKDFPDQQPAFIKRHSISVSVDQWGPYGNALFLTNACSYALACAK